MERKYPTKIEQLLGFKDFCRSRDIEKIFFDLDDTICQTQKVFIDKMDQGAKLISPDKSRDALKIIRAINDELFEAYGVSPARWKFLVERLKNIYALPPERFDRVLETLNQIYTTPVEFTEGSEELLQFLKDADIGCCIVTHGNKDWVWRKYNDWLGLNRFIPWDDIFIVDENGHKTAESWSNAASYFNIAPRKVMVVGDSPRSDMCAIEAGFGHVVWVNSDEKLIWRAHRRKIDERVVRVDRAIDIINFG